jgi:hypothetical protein
MKVADFIAEFRRVTGDKTVPYLWADADILAFLNDAIGEACERALLIEDRISPRVCTLVLVAGQDSYKLHDSVIRVKRIAFRGRPLDETSVEAEDANDYAWESRVGEPRRFIQSPEGRLRIVPTPAPEFADAQLDLTVYRRPIEARTLTGDTAGAPEVPERFHQRLMNWVYKRAYSVDDPEIADPARADRYDRLFAADFGVRVDANVQRKQRDRKPPVTRFRF